MLTRSCTRNHARFESIRFNSIRFDSQIARAPIHKSADLDVKIGGRAARDVAARRVDAAREQHAHARRRMCEVRRLLRRHELRRRGRGRGRERVGAARRRRCAAAAAAAAALRAFLLWVHLVVERDHDVEQRRARVLARRGRPMQLIGIQLKRNENETRRRDETHTDGGDSP